MPVLAECGESARQAASEDTYHFLERAGQASGSAPAKLPSPARLMVGETSIQLVSGGGRPSWLRMTMTASSTGPLAAVSCRSNACSRDSDTEAAAAAVSSDRAWLLMTSNRAIVSVPAGKAMRASR